MVNGRRKQRRDDAKRKISAGRISLVDRCALKRRSIGFKSVSRVGDGIKFARCTVLRCLFDEEEFRRQFGELNWLKRLSNKQKIRASATALAVSFH